MLVQLILRKQELLLQLVLKIKKTNTVLSWEKIEKQMKKGKVKLTTEEQAAFEQWKLGKSKKYIYEKKELPMKR